MKMRLATIIDRYPLRLALLLEKAYSDGADLILSSKESGLDFILLFVFQGKGHFEGKNCLSSVAHET